MMAEFKVFWREKKCINKNKGNGVLVMSDSDHLLSGVFSGDIEAGIVVKNAVFKKGGFVSIFKSETYIIFSRQKLIVCVEQSKCLINQRL